jgi:ankyrin repeat protein
LVLLFPLLAIIFIPKWPNGCLKTVQVKNNEKKKKKNRKKYIRSETFAHNNKQTTNTHANRQTKQITNKQTNKQATNKRTNNKKQTQQTIKTNTDVNKQAPDCETALHSAASRGSIECIKLLLKYGAKFDLIDERGKFIYYLFIYLFLYLFIYVGFTF